MRLRTDIICSLILLERNTLSVLHRLAMWLICFAIISPLLNFGLAGETSQALAPYSDFLESLNEISEEARFIYKELCVGVYVTFFG